MDPDARVTLTGSSGVAIALLVVSLYLRNFELVLTAAGLFAASFAVAMVFDRLAQPA